jgi:mannose-6-phosphate isomerase-like protein (cupin superfamily)
VNDPAVASRFEVIDPATRPIEPVGSFFPEGFKRILLHEEKDDYFEMAINEETTVGPYRLFYEHVKFFLFEGVVRPDPTSEGTPGVYLYFPKGVNSGGDKSLETFRGVFWAPSDKAPFAEPFPEGEQGATGPAVPPGKTASEYILSLAKIPAFTSWVNMRRIYANVGWPDGVDLKPIDIDKTVGNTTQLFRLRPGRTTPTFTLGGNTHFFVIQGEVRITPAGGETLTVGQYQYAFVPKNLALRVANPKKYDGIGAK